MLSSVFLVFQCSRTDELVFSIKFLELKIRQIVPFLSQNQATNTEEALNWCGSAQGDVLYSQILRKRPSDDRPHRLVDSFQFCPDLKPVIGL